MSVHMRRGNGKPLKCWRTRKWCYRTELDAKIALANTELSRSSRREERRAYHCPHCHRWHLTKRA